MSSTSITADQSADVYAYAIDQHGNLVTGQTITYSVSNGSMLGSTFYPYSVGTHIVTAQWTGPSNTLTQDLSVTVSPGQAQTVELSGCDIVVNADTTLTYMLQYTTSTAILCGLMKLALIPCLRQMVKLRRYQILHILNHLKQMY